MNYVTLIGRMTADPEIATYNKAEGQGCYCKFSLAINRNKDNCDFIPCIAWDKTAEAIERYCEKGHNLAVSGTLVQEKFKNKEGKNTSRLTVYVNKIDLIQPKSPQPKAEFMYSDTDSAPKYPHGIMPKTDAVYVHAEEPADLPFN